MLKYTVRRLLQSLLTILIVMTIVFLLLRLLPTDYYFTEEQLIKLSDAQMEDQLRAAGLLDNIFVQLFRKYSQLALSWAFSRHALRMALLTRSAPSILLS